MHFGEYPRKRDGVAEVVFHKAVEYAQALNCSGDFASYKILLEYDGKIDSKKPPHIVDFKLKTLPALSKWPLYFPLKSF
jgi:hypothetical protein